MSRRKLMLGFVVVLCLLGLSSVSVMAAPAFDETAATAAGGILLYTCPPGQDAVLILHRNGGALEILNSGTVVAQRDAATTVAIIINGPTAHSASLTVDYAGGAIVKPTAFTGGAAGANSITLRGGTFTDIVYAPLDAIAGSIAADSAVISYIGVDTVTVLSAAGALSVVQPAYLAGPINVVDGPAIDSLATTEINSGESDGFAPLRFANATSATIYGNASANVYTLANPQPAAGLHALTFDGSDAGNAFTVFTTVAGGTVTLNTGAGHDVVTVQATNADGPLFVNGIAGDDDVNIGNVGSVQGILGAVSISNAAGATDLTVDDSADTTARTATISGEEIVGLAPATIHYAATIRELIVHGGSGGNTITIAGTVANATTTVNTGAGSDTVNIQATASGGPLFLNGQAGSDIVTVGDAGSVQQIRADVAITNAGGATTLTVDDSRDASGRTATLTASQITGLAPATIRWGATVTALVINGGADANTFVIASTLAGAATTLNNGAGSDSISIQTTAADAPLAIHGGGGQDAVFIGQAGSVQAILGAVSIDNPIGQVSVVLDDSADTTARTVTVSDQQVVGLAPAAISYSPTDVNVLIVHGGSGSSLYTVASIPAASNTTINCGAGNNQARVQTTGDGSSLTLNGQGGDDAVFITNNGSVHGILGDVNASTNAGQMTMLVDDSADTEGHTATITESRITGMAPGRINMGNMASITILAGQGSDTLNLTPSASVPFRLEGSAPTPPVLPGDTLDVNLDGVTAPILTIASYDDLGYRGTWTFANRQTVTFGGMETLKPTAALVLTKAADKNTVVTGDLLTYTISVVNGGPNDAENVVVSDNLPPQVHFESITAPAGWACVTPAVGSSGLVECSKAIVAPGESAAIVVVVRSFSWPTGGDMPNSAAVVSTTADPDPSNNTDSVTVRVLPRLAIAVGAQRDTLPPTWIARFTITVTNESQTLLPEITITDPLPDPTLFVRALDGGQLADGVVTWTLTDVPAGAIRVLHVEMWTNSTFHGLIDNWVTAGAYGFSIRANKVVRITP